MSDTVIVAVISFLGTLAGSLGGLRLVTYRLEQLEAKVNKHNNVIERTYILEEQMKMADHRIENLERREESRRIAGGRK